MAPLVAAATTAAELADPAEFAVPLVAAELTAEDPLADVTTMPFVVEWCFGLSRVLFPFTTTDPPPVVPGALFSAVVIIPNLIHGYLKTPFLHHKVSVFTPSKQLKCNGLWAE